MMMNDITHLGRSEEHQGGTLQDGPCRGHLSPPPFVFEVVLPVPRHVGKVHHLAPELAEGFDELGKVVDSFQPRERVGYLVARNGSFFFIYIKKQDPDRDRSSGKPETSSRKS